MSSYAEILNRHFSRSSANEYHTIQHALKDLHPEPNLLHLTIIDPGFPLSGFLKAEGVQVDIADSPRSEYITCSFISSVLRDDVSTADGSLQGEDEQTPVAFHPSLLAGELKFRYKDTDFIVYKLTWLQMHNAMYVIIFEAPEDVVQRVTKNFETDSAGHELIADAYLWSEGYEPDTLWVFQGGRWKKDKELRSAIEKTSWSDLVLEEDFIEGLRRDTKTFFENRDIYQDIGAVWKRGLLLLGPPGNGKTETIKVLLKESGQTALYVKSFNTMAVSTIFCLHAKHVNHAFAGQPSRRKGHLRPRSYPCTLHPCH